MNVSDNPNQKFMRGDELLAKIRETTSGDSATPFGDTTGVDTSKLFTNDPIVYDLEEQTEDGKHTVPVEVVFRPPMMRSYLRATGSFVKIAKSIGEVAPDVYAKFKASLDGTSKETMNILDLIEAIGSLLVDKPEVVLETLAVFMPAPYNDVKRLDRLTPKSIMDSITFIIILMDLEKIVDAFFAARAPIMAAFARARKYSAGRSSQGNTSSSSASTPGTQ